MRNQSSASRSALVALGSKAAVDVVWAGLVVGALAWFALSMSHVGRVAAIWPANAVILARLVRLSPRRWPAYLVAGLLGNVCGDMLAGDAPLAGLVLSLCNTLEIAACAVLVRRFVGAKPDLSQMRQLAIYAVSAALSAAASSAVAAIWLTHTQGRPFLGSMAVWGFADLLGLMVVAPALMALDRQGLQLLLTPGRRLANLGLLALLVTIIALVGLQPHHQFSYLIFAALMVVAYKGETTGAAVGLLAAGGAFMAVTALGLGRGGDNSDPVVEGLLVQVFLLAGAMIAFPIAGAMTRRRQLQVALAASARDFQTLADNSTDVIVRIDRNQRIVYVSPSCRQFGYEPTDVLGRRLDDFAVPGERDANFHSREAVMRGESGADQVYERRLVTASGEHVWVEGSPKVLLGTDGKPEGMITQLRDVTARRAAQAALAESETRYRLLAERSTDIILRLDACGVIRYISPACRRLGYAPEEMIGRPAVDFLHADDHAMAQARSQALYEGEVRASGDARQYRAVTKGGEVIWLEGEAALSHDDAGGLVDIVTHLRDVTERRAFEDELRRKRTEAEAATQAKSEFLANMSHEIRTPLTGILGFAGLLQEEADLTPAQRTYANRIATASRTLLTVVNDILDFSKIEAGQVELDPQPFDPVAFAVETVELVAAQADEKGLELNVAIDGALPPAVSADPARLRQVLLNLLTNAIKFTETGGVSVIVAHAPADGGGMLKVSVQDTGVGIAADRLPRLFQRFSQGDGSISRQYGGTGLGLAISKSLATLMGGQIGVESAEGQGARFWFSLQAPACARPEAPDAEVPGGIEAQPARILVVDDSPVNRELVGVLLGVFGHELSEASGGAEAVLAASEKPFDLILMDLQMPGMDGLAATRAIRAGASANRTTPIVALSANILPTHLDACRAAGMNDHIGKPIDTRELLTKVARWTAAQPASADQAAA
ncbi:MAG TPA: PAS domain S-box protein [Caulobacteraceae bacterium]|nr:PAS domain S-box protein [Caulobacteraceae bacterium]